MEFRLLNINQMREIYDRCLTEDFPWNERAPYSHLARLFKRNVYFPYALVFGDCLIGYLFLLSDRNRKVVSADYFAVLKPYRNRGFGSIAFRALQKKLCDFDYLILEAEDSDFAKDSQKRRLMERRLNFYTRNGVRFISKRARTFGAHYRLGVLPLRRDPSEAEIARAYLKIYDERLMFPFIRKLLVKILTTGEAFSSD